MTSPDQSPPALQNLSPQTLSIFRGPNILRYPSSATPPLRRNLPLAGPASTDVRRDLQQEHEMLGILQNATREDRGTPLPPCVSLMVESAEYLAATALDSWETLCSELECHRAVFKFCCSSQGAFDQALFQSYCNRLRLIHNSIRCGMLVALRALLDQLRVWLQIRAATANTGQPYLADENAYAATLRQLVATLQGLERNMHATQFPDATKLARDPSLMTEIWAQYEGNATRSNSEGVALEGTTSRQEFQLSTAIYPVQRPQSTLANGPSSPIAQFLRRQRSTSSMSGGTSQQSS
jgi:hypothetical protein